MIGGYKILEKVGEGGMGTVFRGIDVMLERQVALKLLRPELTHMPDLVKRFHTEAVALARLNHPHIVTLHQLFRDGDQYFMVLEFVRGETLDRLIKRCSPIPWQTACPLICQALAGLEHAHILKVVHRDIKPANLILTQTGIVKLMDFGIARMRESGDLTQVGNMIGTLKYMSPEQIQGEDIDHLADIYAVGAVLYEMLTGHPPFDGKTDYELIRAKVEADPKPLRAFVPDIPSRLEAAVLRALARSAQERFESAGKFRSELEAILKEATSGSVHSMTFDTLPPVLDLMKAIKAAARDDDAAKAEVDAGGGSDVQTGADAARDEKALMDDDKTVIMESRYPKVIIPRPGHNKTVVNEASVKGFSAPSEDVAEPQSEPSPDITAPIEPYAPKSFEQALNKPAPSGRELSEGPLDQSVAPAASQNWRLNQRFLNFEPRVGLVLLLVLPVAAIVFWANSIFWATPDPVPSASADSFPPIETTSLMSLPEIPNREPALPDKPLVFPPVEATNDTDTVIPPAADGGEQKPLEPTVPIARPEEETPPTKPIAVASETKPTDPVRVSKPVAKKERKKVKPRPRSKPSRSNNVNGGWAIVTE
ncbi:hypothetical protein sS8_4198 [Methylocaldum marinum]|uniref:non-specific serine/threonine protein kinase n=1 Tax=Methylocaldum marinum TaxID=1432792 RepID=A0A250KWR7_9GAMM|nr:hypothetical protein sS8_4198 [Methylocaldum marinum]